MLDLRELTRQIRAALTREGDFHRDTVVELAGEYKKACVRLQKKAEKCRRLLQKGNRAAAVRLARRPPDLSTVFEVLNFPEKDLWLGICEGYGASPQVELDDSELEDLLADLYGRNVNLDYLLSLHRRMALGQAPIGDRVKVLRWIYQADPDSKHWEKDLKDFEPAYIHHLSRAAKKADRKKDLNGLEAILSELKSSDWIKRSPTSALLQSVEKRAHPYRKNAADARYLVLSEQIRDAHSAMDEETCRQLLAEWDSVKEQTTVGPEPDVAEQMEPVRAWLAELRETREEEAEFEGECAALEKAIDDDHPINELERQAARILRFDRGMPELLAARFHSRIQELKRAGRRRFSLIVTGTVLAAGLLAVLLFHTIHWRRAVQTRQRWQNQIESALAAEDLNRAETLLTELREHNPNMLKEPELRDLEEQFKRESAEERARVNRFRELMSTVAKDLETDPDPETAGETLETAEEVAQTFEEKTQIENWRDQIRAHVAQQERQTRQKYEEKLTELESAWVDLRNASRELGDPPAPGAVDSSERKASHCLILAAGLIEDDLAPTAIRERARTIQTATRRERDGWLQKIERHEAVQRALHRVERAFQYPEVFVDELRSFVEQFPDHSLTAEFQQALQLEPHWTAVERWRQSSRRWWQRVPRISNPELIESRLATVTEFLEEYDSPPSREAIEEYRVYLETAREAIKDGQLHTLQQITELLQWPFYTEAKIIKEEGGNQYYIFDYDKRPGTYIFRYITQVDGTLSRRNIHIPERNIEHEPVAAPHVELARQLQKQIKDFELQDWPTFYLELANTTVKAKEVEPILRVALLHSFLRLAKRSTPWESDPVSRRIEHLDEIATRSEVTVNWMNPANSDADELRRFIVLRVNTLDSFDTIIEMVEEKAEGLSEQLRPYEVVGLMLDSRDDIHLDGNREDGTLYMLHTDSNNRPQFGSVGELVRGEPRLRPATVNRRYPRGSLVFMKARE